VPPVRGQVEKVVHEINARCAQRKCDKCHRGPRQQRDFKQPVHRRQRHEYQTILDPMQRTQRTQVVLPARLLVRDHLHRGHPGDPLRQMVGRGREQRPPRRVPNRRIAQAVADVIESLKSPLRDQPVAFALRAEIDLAVARDDAIEQPQRTFDLARQPCILRGGQNQAAAEPLLAVQKLDHVGALRQQPDIGHRRLGEPLFQECTALEQPSWQFQQAERRRSCQHKHRLDQAVGAQQSTVEVHHERHAILDRCRVILGGGFGLLCGLPCGQAAQKTHLASCNAPFFHGTRWVSPVLPSDSARLATYHT